jgi:hypothetical protein
MGCLSACSPDITPAQYASCDPAFMKGGIRALGFLKCDASFDEVSGQSIADVAVWEALLESGDLFLTAPVIGSKPKGSATNLRVQSCAPEIVVNRTQTISFRDYNADLEDLSHYDFWISIQQNYQSLQLVYITCEGYVYGPFDNKTWVLDLDDVREETSEQPVFMDGTITITKLLMTKPVLVDGVLNILP